MIPIKRVYVQNSGPCGFVVFAESDHPVVTNLYRFDNGQGEGVIFTGYTRAMDFVQFVQGKGHISKKGWTFIDSYA